jgi:hypothetical protein
MRMSCVRYDSYDRATRTGDRTIKNVAHRRTDAIATLILEELEEEQRWDDSFAHSPDLLAKLAAEAMTEYRAGKTQELDPETL